MGCAGGAGDGVGAVGWAGWGSLVLPPALDPITGLIETFL